LCSATLSEENNADAAATALNLGNVLALAFGRLAATWPWALPSEHWMYHAHLGTDLCDKYLKHKTNMGILSH